MVRRRFSCLDQCIEKFVPLICSDDVVYVTWVLHIPLMWCLFLLFRKGKRAVDASDSDDSSDEEEDEKEKNNGSQVESSGLGMAHDGDSNSLLSLVSFLLFLFITGNNTSLLFFFSLLIFVGINTMCSLTLTSMD